MTTSKKIYHSESKHRVKKNQATNTNQPITIFRTVSSLSMI